MNIVTHSILALFLGCSIVTNAKYVTPYRGRLHFYTDKTYPQEKGGSFTWFRILPLTSNRAANDHPSGFAATTTTTTLHMDVIKR